MHVQLDQGKADNKNKTDCKCMAAKARNKKQTVQITAARNT
jgi:hypothetical protein